ncbi:MAG: Ig-like domain-containing protein, partial [Lachnospiraceae bacterium]|nr:Ig-like domain-containing protein [Lachnospiraceae bacterium]
DDDEDDDDDDDDNDEDEDLDEDEEENGEKTGIVIRKETVLTNKKTDLEVKKTAGKDKKSLKNVAAVIKKSAKNKDTKGSSFSSLKAVQKKADKKSITIQWSKIKGAKKYKVYAAPAGKKLKELKETKKRSLKVRKVYGKKLKKNTYYKFVVTAVTGKSGNEKAPAVSKTIYAALNTGKRTNPGKVTVSSKKIKLRLKKNKKTAKIKAKMKAGARKRSVKKICGFRYESTKPSVASVNSKGKVTAKKAGKATIYVYAQNGKYAKVKVEVKK